MAEVISSVQVVLKVSDAEWRLIMKALGAFAGLKISAKTEDQIHAARLNEQLLKQRQEGLARQLGQASETYSKAREFTKRLDILAAEDPDGSAAISKVAFGVGKEMGLREARAEAEAEESERERVQ